MKVEIVKKKNIIKDNKALLVVFDESLKEDAVCFTEEHILKINLCQKAYFDEKMADICQQILAFAKEKMFKQIIFDIDTFIAKDWGKSYLINLLDNQMTINEENINVIIALSDFSSKDNLFLFNQFQQENKSQMLRDQLVYYAQENDLNAQFNEFRKNIGKKLFREYLMEVIMQRNLTYPEVYKAAGVSKFTFSKILNYKTVPPYKPTKGTVAALTIGFKFSLEEAEKFYNAAGYHLGHTEVIDQAVRFFLKKGQYNIDEVNMLLHDLGHAILGEKSRERENY